MKRILILFLTTVLFTNCTNEEIVQENNYFFEASAFEIENVDFNPSTNFDNDYRVREFYGFQVLPTDVPLVYILWEILSNGTEIWRPLPQTVIFNDGNDLVYNYDFTQSYVDFFLEGSDLDNLDSIWTQNQVFRVVVVPSVNVGRVDLSDLNAVMNFYGITEFKKR